MSQPTYSVSQFVALTNQLLEHAFNYVRIEGEVSNFRISQQKWVSFRLSDDESVIDCFLGVWNLRTPIENGMTIRVGGNPRLKGKWGKFSLTVQHIELVGEGAIAKAQQKLFNKLKQEGLFATERKRALPNYPEVIGLVGSPDAAGTGDFLRVINERWPLAGTIFVHSSVQGAAAPDELIRGLQKVNERKPDVVAMVRGGGSAEDLQAFNDEALVRAVAASRAPIVVGVGHERDETLCEYAADVRASTPTYAAELITPDVSEVSTQLRSIKDNLRHQLSRIVGEVTEQLTRFGHVKQLVWQSAATHLAQQRRHLLEATKQQLSRVKSAIHLHTRLLNAAHPQRILQRGYALVETGSNTRATRAAQLSNDETITLKFFDGQWRATTKEMIE